MKIGYLLQVGEEVRRPPFNGPANHIRHVCKELIRRGHQVRLLARLDGKLWISDNLVDFRPIQVQRSDSGAARLVERAIRRVQALLGLPYLAWFESRRFANACLQELSDSDILLERMSWMAYGGVLAARQMRVPLVLEYNGDPLADLEARKLAPTGAQRKLSTAIQRWMLGQSSHVVASGEGWKMNCAKKWGVQLDEITTIENGTDMIHILDRDRLRAFQPDNNATHVDVVYLGSFYAWHGVQILLQAFARASLLAPQLRLKLIGAGDGFEDAKRLVSDLDLTERVSFSGHLGLEETGSHLAQAEIGVAPYCGWEEFSGLKIFDYKAAGLATIASGKDGQPVTLKHGQTGWIVKPCDIQSLETALVHLASHAELRRQLGRAARVEAERLHGWEHTVDRLEELFHRLLKLDNVSQSHQELTL